MGPTLSKNNKTWTGAQRGLAGGVGMGRKGAIAVPTNVSISGSTSSESNSTFVPKLRVFLHDVLDMSWCYLAMRYM
jgi:hypothetical protein